MVTDPKSVGQQTRALGMPSLAPMLGDGAQTARVLEEIRAYLAAAGDSSCADKFPKWREQLRSARYVDWKRAR